MSTFMSGVDTFEGLREFPREQSQLIHHLSRVNHSLQTRYFIAPEIAEFALQPDKAEDFQKFYAKEVQQIIAHLNKSTRGNIKVRVDGKRIAKGLEIVHSASGKVGGGATRSGSPNQDPRADRLVAGDAAWQASMTVTARKLAEHQVVEQQCLIAATNQTGDADRTPAYSSRKRIDEMLLTSTAGRTGDHNVVDSTAKAQRDDFLFTTPPEFKGFQHGPMATPSESDGPSPGGY